IYRVESKGTQPVTGLCLSRLSSEELVGLLSHRNDWFVREARRILAERRDPAVIPTLRQLVTERNDPLPLQPPWALHVTGGLHAGAGFGDRLAEKLPPRAQADGGTWTLRLLGDAKKVSASIQMRLTDRARTETRCTVRSQLACSCKRLPGKDVLPILRELLQ